LNQASRDGKPLIQTLERFLIAKPDLLWREALGSWSHLLRLRRRLAAANCASGERGALALLANRRNHTPA
jgi:hypothetical protein